MTFTAAPGNSSKSLKSGDHDRPAARTVGWGPHWDRGWGTFLTGQMWASYGTGLRLSQRDFTQEEHPEE